MPISGGRSRFAASACWTTLNHSEGDVDEQAPLRRRHEIRPGIRALRWMTTLPRYPDTDITTDRGSAQRDAHVVLRAVVA